MIDMASAKDIFLRPIAREDAVRAVQRWHYSGKVDPRSQVHIGVFVGADLCGAMQFGPPVDRRKILPLVTDTPWSGVLELNRMAFSDRLPRNSESRAIAVAMRLIRKNAPHVQWVLSYADAAQCGDGAIYRAAGFVLTGIKRNDTIWRMPDGEVIAEVTLRIAAGPGSVAARYGGRPSESSRQLLARIGAERVEGYQLRYVYFIDGSARERLTVSEIPYSEIARLGIGMYKGERVVRASGQGDTSAASRAGRFDSDPGAPNASEATK